MRWENQKGSRETDSLRRIVAGVRVFRGVFGNPDLAVDRTWGSSGTTARAQPAQESVVRKADDKEILPGYTPKTGDRLIVESYSCGKHIHRAKYCPKNNLTVG